MKKKLEYLVTGYTELIRKTEPYRIIIDTGNKAEKDGEAIATRILADGLEAQGFPAKAIQEVTGITFEEEPEADQGRGPVD